VVKEFAKEQRFVETEISPRFQKINEKVVTRFRKFNFLILELIKPEFRKALKSDKEIAIYPNFLTLKERKGSNLFFSLYHF
tara:strand:- start:2077 stop:2319 length:243 start_codon:yes stop_codon:yes gene_type:complete